MSARRSSTIPLIVFRLDSQKHIVEILCYMCVEDISQCTRLKMPAGDVGPAG